MCTLDEDELSIELVGEIANMVHADWPISYRSRRPAL